MLSALRRVSAPRTTTSLAKVAAAATSRRGFISSTDDYGSHLFSGAVADEYLSKQGLPAGAAACRNSLDCCLDPQCNGGASVG